VRVLRGWHNTTSRFPPNSPYTLISQTTGTLPGVQAAQRQVARHIAREKAQDPIQISKAWLEQNALVCWVEDVRPWELEEQLLKRMSLPLNIDGNDHHPYNAKLRSCRTTARVAAKAGQCVADSGGPRAGAR
jgi:hypothetical protein